MSTTDLIEEWRKRARDAADIRARMLNNSTSIISVVPYNVAIEIYTKVANELEKVIQAERDRANKSQAALEKINAIRNSIIGCQSVNWSEHVYPIVAALNEVGIHGMDYPEAKANMGTLIERTNAAEARAEKAEALLRTLNLWKE